MDWRQLSYAGLALWGSYLIFGDKATAIHGARMSMLFEGVAMMAVALFANWNNAKDFSMVTLRSSAFGLTMGLMSAIGMMIQLYAVEAAPSKDAVPVIAMITGSWPAITVVLACLFLGSSLQIQQWLGGLGVAGGLLLVNWVR